MRPVPLHSPWRARRHRLYILLTWMLVGLLLTRPQTTAGIAIAVTAIPALGLVALLLHRWWHNRFARSNLMPCIRYNVHQNVRQSTIRDVSQAVINTLVGDRAILDVMGPERTAIENLAIMALSLP